MNRRQLSYLLLLLLYCSCAPDREETATRGRLRVLIAESVAPVMISAVNRFMSLYQAHGADVTYSVVKSAEANQHFLVDTARTIITVIPLTTDEMDLVKKTTEYLADIVLAYDGVVAVVQSRNPQEEMTLEQIRKILTANITKWEQLGRSRTPHGAIHLIVEDSSDVTAYLSSRLLGGKEIQVPHRRTTSSLETLREVARDPLSLGFIGSSWVDSATTHAKILALGADSALADTVFKPAPESIGKSYSPHPAYLYLNYYPMKRAVHVYSRTARGDFATGFTAFLASPEGQKIFLQMGLVPGTQKIVLKPTGQ
jgi:phosphate transport system substrate-binding protein